MPPRALRIGIAVAAVYVVALAVTVALHADHTRPLYDGFVPPSSYRFVDPPAFFAAGNVEPAATTQRIPLGAGGSAAAGVATPDGQFVLSLGRGALPAMRGATEVAVRITPLAPITLPPVPDGLRPNGNAYRVTMTYEPRGGTVGRLAAPGSLVLEIPEIGRGLFATDHRGAWVPVAAQVITPRQLTMTAPFRVTGTYLAATSLPELAGPSGHASHVALIAGIVTAVLALVVFAGGYALARSRRRRAGRLAR
jgi:hypothetical protein